MKVMKRIKTGTQIAALLAVGVLTAACGGGSSSSESSGSAGGSLPAEITIKVVSDQTGPVGYAGQGALKGAQLAAEEINKEKFLGDGVTLKVTSVDTAGSIETASSEMTKAMADKNVTAIIGPAQGQQAAAVAPLVERTKVPTVFTQAGSEGVVIGDYTFRATAPMGSYYKLAADYAKSKNLTNVAILYNATFPTFSELATKTVPEFAKTDGLNIVTSVPVQSTTQDFTTPVRTAVEKKPDALMMLLTAPQSVTALKQLQTLGYSGQILATSVQGAGNISQAGDAATGLIYPTDYSMAMTQETSVAFTKAYEAKYNANPKPYDAEGYDAAWWIARAIKEAGSADREQVKDGLQSVAKDGFDGAMGKITFEGNDMRVEGALVQWDGTKETLVN